MFVFQYIGTIFTIHLLWRLDFVHWYHSMMDNFLKHRSDYEKHPALKIDTTFFFKPCPKTQLQTTSIFKIWHPTLQYKRHTAPFSFSYAAVATVSCAINLLWKNAFPRFTLNKGSTDTPTLQPWVEKHWGISSQYGVLERLLTGSFPAYRHSS